MIALENLDRPRRVVENLGQPLQVVPVGVAQLGAAVDTLSEIVPPMKKRLLEACAVCIGADHEVTVEEAEMLRAIADGLGCPMPPVLADPPLA